MSKNSHKFFVHSARINRWIFYSPPKPNNKKKNFKKEKKEVDYEANKLIKNPKT